MLFFSVFIVGVFTIGWLLLVSNTVSLVLSVLKGPPAPTHPPTHPLPHRGSYVCPVLVSYFSIVFLNFVLAYFARCWLPFGFHVRTVFQMWGITFLSIVFASIVYRCGDGFGFHDWCSVDTFFVRARGLQKH